MLAVDVGVMVFSCFAARNMVMGDGMKRVLVALMVTGLAGAAAAGGLSEPAMDAAVVAAETASSGNDSWVGIVMTLLVFGAALAD